MESGESLPYLLIIRISYVNRMLSVILESELTVYCKSEVMSHWDQLVEDILPPRPIQPKIVCHLIKIFRCNILQY